VKVKLMVCLLALVLLGSVASPAQATFSARAWRLELLHRINHYRSNHGVHRLKLGPHLGDAASAHSLYMSRHHLMTHYSSSGATWLTRLRSYGFHGNWAGENLGVGLWSPRRMLRAWIASPPHRANLLNGHYRWIGIGISRGIWSGHAAYYVTNDFGGP
jgi:uncharacterized protein YkwD